MDRFDSVLIANRGEIACRIISTAKSLGYRTIAVYTDADEGAPHMQMADQAINIGSGPVAQSYLSAEMIIAAAQEANAGAVHPGYGFLSENAQFAAAVRQAGMVFIGPSAEAIEVMGNKAEAKRRMLEAGVPCVPGYHGADQSHETLMVEAGKIGVPLMVKAATGGGGRGMRLVTELSELGNAIELASSEARNAFGSDQLILEKAIAQPRHVEIQVFADGLGHTIHLAERDCSVQRRHQKVIEEAPCPVMTPELRQAMGAAAIAAARSIEYLGAGTVEFLLDSDGEFYFLEMNTRLQVEHPVTEMVTGLDLVALQLRVAQGQPLGIEQSSVKLRGHAIEVRLYTEDPSQDFLPVSGTIEHWQPPSGDGIRVDDGIRSGQTIAPYYDPMVAKIVGYGANREVARRRLTKALAETRLYGLASNQSFLSQCLQHDEFISGEATTAFIEQHFPAQSLQAFVPDSLHAVCAALLDLQRCWQASMANSTNVSPQLRDWSSADSLQSRRRYQSGAELFDLTVKPQAEAAGSYLVSVEGESAILVASIEAVSEDSATLAVQGDRIEVGYLWHGAGDISLAVGPDIARFEDQLSNNGSDTELRGDGNVLAPMHGSVSDVRVSRGQHVEPGDSLLVLEAMKMQHEIVAEQAGEITDIWVQSGDQVATDAVLIEIAADKDTDQS
ncbi:MAG: acetyl-CoA carboxylase biotin carboxylase subunit [Gammaproteobacteria bacterium]|nr:acetyl-CoA carboxylase biotin carboxylase subunit [Gammaproteobacteria bacterium]